MQYDAKGIHTIIDLYECNKTLLNSPQIISQALTKSCLLAGCKEIKEVVHQFKPQGVTGIILLEESHISIHTYPEYGICFIDIYTCGLDATPELTIPFFRRFFEAKSEKITKIERGKI